MAKKDDVRSFNQIKAYPRGSAQGGRAIQAVKGNMTEYDGIDGHRTVVRETSEGRAIARTRDRMPMVEVEKNECVIGVDHGVVDVLTVAPLHPNAYTDGNLHFTSYVTEHLAGAEPDDPDRPIVDEIEPPDTIKGEPPLDGEVAKSFRAKRIENRESLYLKKVTAMNCPPSIFTGRMRLWVQALYGRHDALTLVRLSTSNPYTTPSIEVGTSDPVHIHTGCGIYFEAETGKHWLIKVQYDYADIYPLEADDCIEELRAFLIDPDFPQADKERVECYILSDCLPVVSKMQRLTFSAQHGYSMGYGWHFNWTGNRCDLVYTEEVYVVGSSTQYENSSTHYRLEFTKNAEAFSVTKSIVEGPVRWKSYRHLHPITYPDWFTSTLIKSGAHIGPEPYGNAPFYAFYNRDELRVCRYSAVTAQQAKGGTRSPDYLNPQAPYSIGSDPILYTVWNEWPGVSVTLSCGPASVAYTSGARSGSERSRTAPVMVEVLWGSVFYVPGDETLSGLTNGRPTSYETTTITDSYMGSLEVLNTGGGVTGLTYSSNTIGPGGYKYSVNTKSSITAKQIIYDEQFSTGFIGVIPFNDAEAFYMLGTMTRYRTDDVAETSALCYDWYQVLATEGGAHVFVTETAEDGTSFVAGTVVSANYVDVHDPQTAIQTKLVCNSGVIDGVSFPATGAFFSPLVENVEQTFDTRSSASGEAVVSSATGVLHGTPMGGVFVGWA